MAEQAVVAAAVCEGSLESFRDLMGDLVDMEGVIVGLAMYMVLSLVWGLARVVYFWKKGPTRGHFPPDELVARLVLAIFGACLKSCVELAGLVLHLGERNLLLLRVLHWLLTLGVG